MFPGGISALPQGVKCRAFERVKRGRQSERFYGAQSGSAICGASKTEKRRQNDDNSAATRSPPCPVRNYPPLSAPVRAVRMNRNVLRKRNRKLRIMRGNLAFGVENTLCTEKQNRGPRTKTQQLARAARSRFKQRKSAEGNSPSEPLFSQSRPASLAVFTENEKSQNARKIVARAICPPSPYPIEIQKTKKIAPRTRA